MKEDFIGYLLGHVGRAIYVWGGQGETDITEEWIRARETSAANAERAIAYWKKQQAAGISPIAAFDCSGLIVHYLKDVAGFLKSDMTAAGLYRQCTPVARNDLARGDLVFRHNGKKIHHVGVYLGDGTAVEAQGRDAGVTRRALDAGGTGYWNRCGRLPLPAGAGGEHGHACFATVGGGSVYVRAGRGKAHKALGVAHKGDALLALPPEDGWCQVAAVLNGAIATGYMAERYVERAGAGAQR